MYDDDGVKGTVWDVDGDCIGPLDVDRVVAIVGCMDLVVNDVGIKRDVLGIWGRLEDPITSELEVVVLGILLFDDIVGNGI